MLWISMDAMDIYGSVPLGCLSRWTRWTPRQRKQQRSRWPMSTQATGENRDLPRVQMGIEATRMRISQGESDILSIIKYYIKWFGVVMSYPEKGADTRFLPALWKRIRWWWRRRWSVGATNHTLGFGSRLILHASTLFYFYFAYCTWIDWIAVHQPDALRWSPDDLLMIPEKSTSPGVSFSERIDGLKKFGLGEAASSGRSCWKWAYFHR